MKMFRNKMTAVLTVFLALLVFQFVSVSTAEASMSGSWTGKVCGSAYAGFVHVDHTCAQFLRVKHIDGSCTVTAIRISASPLPFNANSGAKPYATDDYSKNPSLSFGSFVLLSANAQYIKYFHGADSMGKHPGGLLYKTYDIPDHRVSSLRLNLNGARAHLSFFYKDVTQNLVLKRAC
jgi:hypothetical protein